MDNPTGSRVSRWLDLGPWRLASASWKLVISCLSSRTASQQSCRTDSYAKNNSINVNFCIEESFDPSMSRKRLMELMIPVDNGLVIFLGQELVPSRPRSVRRDDSSRLGMTTRVGRRESCSREGGKTR